VRLDYATPREREVGQSQFKDTRQSGNSRHDDGEQTASISSYRSQGAGERLLHTRHAIRHQDSFSAGSFGGGRQVGERVHVRVRVEFLYWR
jgi:hypothetical protein